MRTKPTRSSGRNPAGTAAQRAARARERREAVAVADQEFGERLREAERVYRETGETGRYGAQEAEEEPEVRGGLKGGQTRAFERLFDPAPIGTRWRMGRLFWLPSGVQTVVLRTHRLELVHNGSRPARCARVSVYPRDAHLDERRQRHRRLEVFIPSPKLSTLVARYDRWTPLRISATGRGSWSVVEAPKWHELWLAAHILEQHEGTLVGPAALE